MQLLIINLRFFFFNISLSLLYIFIISLPALAFDSESSKNLGRIDRLDNIESYLSNLEIRNSQQSKQITNLVKQNQKSNEQLDKLRSENIKIISELRSLSLITSRHGKNSKNQNLNPTNSAVRSDSVKELQIQVEDLKKQMLEQKLSFEQTLKSMQVLIEQLQYNKVMLKKQTK